MMCEVEKDSFQRSCRVFGRAIAEKFAANGAFVTVGDVADCESKHKNITFVNADLSTLEGCETLVEECGDNDVDVLVNNCAVQESIPCHEMSEDEWRRVLDINLTSYFRMAKQTRGTERVA